MKKNHLSAIDLSFGCAIGETHIERQKEAKREEFMSKQGKKFCSPCPSFSSNSHAISSPFQVFIMSMKCPSSNPK